MFSENMFLNYMQHCRDMYFVIQLLNDINKLLTSYVHAQSGEYCVVISSKRNYYL